MKKIMLVILVFLLCLSCTGCWSRQEIDTLGIVGSVVYGMTPEKEVNMQVEIVNYGSQSADSSGGEDGQEPFLVRSGKGRNISEAVTNITDSLERILYMPFVQVRFFTEEYAKQDISDSVEFVIFDNKTRESAYLVIIKGENADKLYQCKPQLESTIGDYYGELAKSQKNADSSTVFVKTLDFLRAANSKTREPVAGVVEIIEKPQSEDDSASEKEPNFEMKYGGTAVFRDMTLVGYLNDHETQAYNLIVNNYNGTTITIPFEETQEENSIEVNQSNCKILTDFRDNRAYLTLEVTAKVTLLQSGQSKSLSDKKELQKIKKAIETHLKRDLDQTVSRAQQEFQSDIFGFGESMHIHHPQIWSQIEDQWPDFFSNAVLDVSVDVEINRINESLKH